ncbi:MAG: HD domain-containing protein [Prevotellaceae bacterium]|jgi:HD superfamily phosphohydrolase|nr:HD domain-containing protein [Prevotellaceae bacterium]
MKNLGNKSFLDSVHGYIYIDSDYCKEIIDTPIFQRLRRIEQTSFRGLCPSARHDRFIHSLGVYHMGAKMFQEIKNNLKHNNRRFYDEINNLFGTAGQADGWNFLNQVFEIACLLHDCGHAPFSHTFEKYYVQEKSILVNDILNQVTLYRNLDEIQHHGYNDDEIKKLKIELESRISKIKEHELASAWLVIHRKGFRNVFLNRKIKLDPVLAVRMITGCKHLKKANFQDSEGKYIIEDVSVIPEQLSEKQQIENCFISLLNGHIIDADRLDYFARDRWATGLNTNSVDIDRLLSSISIKENKEEIVEDSAKKEIKEYVVCVNKRAIPELKNIIDVKEFLDYWIINHHKVVYDNKVLVKAVTKLSCLMCNEKYEENEKDKIENDSLYKIFNYKSFIEAIPLSFEHNGHSHKEILHLTSDDDLVYLLKKFYCAPSDDEKDNNYAKEWLYREHHLFPLWKSYAEFVDTFKDFSLNSTQIYKDLVTSVSKTVDTFINKKKSLPSFHFKRFKPLLLRQNAHPCLVDEDEGEPIYIDTGKSILRYSAMPYLTGRFKSTGNFISKDGDIIQKCTNTECRYSEKACVQSNKEHLRNDRNWEYFYLFLPRIYKKSKGEEPEKEFDKPKYETLQKELITEIIKEYKLSLQVIS